MIAVLSEQTPQTFSSHFLGALDNSKRVASEVRHNTFCSCVFTNEQWSVNAQRPYSSRHCAPFLQQRPQCVKIRSTDFVQWRHNKHRIVKVVPALGTLSFRAELWPFSYVAVFFPARVGSPTCRRQLATWRDTYIYVCVCACDVCARVPLVPRTLNVCWWMMFVYKRAMKNFCVWLTERYDARLVVYVL
jgi:hypothetical protein